MKRLGKYEHFSEVTRKSLQHALAEHNVELNVQQTDKLMEAYDSLSTFPDVNPALKRLAENKAIDCVVFSNGTQTMVSNSVHKSGSLDASVFKALITVDAVEKFKPAPEVYHHLINYFGKIRQESDIWLVSGNPFDVVGARAIGMEAAWVDRAGNGWQDRLGQEPTVIVRSLEEVVDVVEKFTGGK